MVGVKTEQRISLLERPPQKTLLPKEGKREVRGVGEEGGEIMNITTLRQSLLSLLPTGVSHIRKSLL